MKLSMKFENNCASGTVMTVSVSEIQAGTSADLINLLTMFKRATKASYGIPPLEVARLLTVWIGANGTKFVFKVVNETSVGIWLYKGRKRTGTVLVPEISKHGLVTGTITVKP